MTLAYDQGHLMPLGFASEVKRDSEPFTGESTLGHNEQWFKELCQPSVGNSRGQVETFAYRNLSYSFVQYVRVHEVVLCQ